MDQRSKSSKPMTIHGYAQSGNLSGVQRLLRETPSLLNDKNPIMVHTPLHVAAAYNRIEIMNFLFNWNGVEKVDLEAQNMVCVGKQFDSVKSDCTGVGIKKETEKSCDLISRALIIRQYGETPLHMAAKNGCDEAVKLLLSHGALLEARALNGMTPLHLAVWHSLGAGDCCTVQTLLEHGADCSAKDSDGSTPISHLSPGQGNKNLMAILNYHLDEQRKRRAIEACSETQSKMDQLELELAKIVGLTELKVQLRKWARGMLLDERRRALGLKVASRRPPHMAFLGNPGTGKTMVARVLGKLLFMVGILPTDKVTEVQRTDLVGEFVGHTGPKTRRVLKEAEGGILFVDEAYRLIPMQKSDDKDYGIEALEEIMSIMDSGKIVVIFAGYKEPMQRVIYSNEGFCRRVTKFFHFHSFDCQDLAKITHLKMNEDEQAEGSLLSGFKLHKSCSVDTVAALIEKKTTDKQRKEMNGGLIDPMLVNARENLDLRLSFDCVDTEELLTITLEDLEAGLHVLAQQ